MQVARSRLERINPFPHGLPMLFVHTPKCGGSYLQQAFKPYGKHCISLTEPILSGHLIWRQYRDRLKLLDRSISDFVTFSVVRNPFDWHVSWFNYIRQPQGGRRSGYHVEHRLFQKMGFSDYIDWLEDPSAVRSMMFDMGRQVSDWVTDENGNIAVDELLRQENLAHDLDAMRERYGLLIQAPEKRVNVSNRCDYRSVYTSRDVDVIARRHARDLEMFGYTFD